MEECQRADKNWAHFYKIEQFSIETLKAVFPKVRSSYGPLAYFSNIFISGKNVVFSFLKETHFQKNQDNF